MSEYTPTTDEVRDSYRFSNKRPDICGKDFGAEFDRWRASIRAAALDEAAEVVKSQTPGPAEWGTEWAEGFEQATETSASAIRALKEEKK